MKNIEIKTTQNVVLEYELANLRDRIVGYLIDLACIGGGIAVLSFIGYVILGFTGIVSQVFGIFQICIFVFYTLVMEILNDGQSVGKMAMRIQVIKTAGGHATFSDYTARWVFRMIDIYFSLGGIASILVASSAKAQRIGDIVAGTAVVKLVPKIDLKLEDLLKLHSSETYQPLYVQAKQLPEEDVLLIKATLDRYAKFKNRAHAEALSLLAQKVKEILVIDHVDSDDRRFLQTVLKDYVVLTR